MCVWNLRPPGTGVLSFLQSAALYMQHLFSSPVTTWLCLSASLQCVEWSLVRAPQEGHGLRGGTQARRRQPKGSSGPWVVSEPADRWDELHQRGESPALYSVILYLHNKLVYCTALTCALLLKTASTLLYLLFSDSILYLSTYRLFPPSWILWDQ